jgi:cytochrome c oxidase assembly protein subunit 15
MTSELFDLAPAARLLLLGAALALVPFFWTLRRHRRAGARARWRAVTVLTLFLTFDLVLFGAFTRLTDSGLGCPDWPGCYGSSSPVGAREQIRAAETALPGGPVTHGKAWIEMVHRYIAMGVGAIITVSMLAAWTMRFRTWRAEASPGWATATFLWVCAQGAFGALTVTMKLYPAIVTLHLLGGVLGLSLLTAQVQRGAAEPREVVGNGLRAAMWLVLALLWAQVALGG